MPAKPAGWAGTPAGGRARRQRPSFWRSPVGLAVVVALAGVVALSFVLPGVLGSKPASSSPAVASGVTQGAGLRAGSAVPAFSGTDVVTGRVISSSSIYDHRTLLFFSEGVACQACLEQIQGIEQMGSQMAERGIQLVSITPDPPGVLRQAIAGYRITTPIISDTTLAMSQVFNTLGQGMHSDTPGHAFALIYHGKVLWYHDYWISNNTMYVPPATLLAALPTA